MTEVCIGSVVEVLLMTDNQLYNVRYALAEWYGAGLAIARSRAPISLVAAVYQRQLSVPSPGSVIEYQRKLGSKRAYHVMH